MENNSVENKIVLPREKVLEIACNLVGCFESFLEDKGIVIDNPEKEENKTGDPEEDSSIANIYGSDYYSIEDEILGILKKQLGVVIEDEIEGEGEGKESISN